MAHEWYLQHGGKLYGPLTSANLKKLATDGKITPTTQVRLGSDGAWGPASRVQGLFAAAQPSAPPSAAQPARTAAPPIAPPAPPPMANPLARVPIGRVAPKAVLADGGSMPAKIIGAVALIFGILALATFWLPMVGGLMGWIGIVVGALGLLLSIAGLVLASMHKGSGLYLNVAGASSSIVGLVLTVALGSLYGLFGSAPQPIPVGVVAPPPKPVVQQPPPLKQPEPEPEPEPVWTDARESIQQGNIKASIESAKIENLRLESSDPSVMKKQKPQPMLKIRVTIENTSADKIVEVPGWSGGGGLIPKELEAAVGNLLGSQGGAAAIATATLTDNAGNPYKQTPGLMLAGAKLTVGEDTAVRPGKAVAIDLVFPPPLETIEYLRLELSPAGFSGEEPLRFQIPKELIAGP